MRHLLISTTISHHHHTHSSQSPSVTSLGTSHISRRLHPSSLSRAVLFSHTHVLAFLLSITHFFLVYQSHLCSPSLPSLSLTSLLTHISLSVTHISPLCHSQMSEQRRASNGGRPARAAVRVAGSSCNRTTISWEDPSGKSTTTVAYVRHTSARIQTCRTHKRLGMS